MRKSHVLQLLFVLLVLPASGFGQVHGGAAFLQGDYLEIGVAACGAYGTSQAPPALGAAGTAYHPTELGLGFVADSDMDGWNAGSPAYCGDYFLPGSPVEGFTMNIGGQRYNNSSGFGICSTEEIPGAIVGYRSGDTLSATWAGEHSDGFRVQIRTYFPRNKRYFIGEVTVENTGDETLYDLYFSRQVDPDNDQAWGGGYPTHNRIVSQPGPGHTDALVTAEGTMGCFLGLGARHFASRVSRGGFFINHADEPYCGESPYALSGEATTDDAIGVNFYFARLEPGRSLSFSYAYILDEADLEEALQATSAPVLLADGIPVLPEEDGSPALVRLCAGDSVYLEVQGGDNYTWNWHHHGDFRPDGPLAGWLFPGNPGSYGVSSSVPCGDDLTFSFELELGEVSTQLAALTDVAVCPGSPVVLGQGADLSGLSLSWSPAHLLSNASSSQPVLLADTAAFSQVFSVRGADALGCSATDSVRVVVHPRARVSAGPDKAGVIGTKVTLEGSGAEHYAWSPASYLDFAGSARPQAVVIDTMQFTVLGTDANGCQASDTMNLYALQDQRYVVPNAFSPDGDGLNDCFRPGRPHDAELRDVRIFNRWGDLVYFSRDADQCWDGTFQGQPQPMGVFVVVITLLSENGELLERSSSLTLIR